MQVLLIGPLPPPIGGDTRLFSFLVSDLEKVPGFRVDVLNSSRGTRPNSIVRIVLVMLRLTLVAIARFPSADVISFHASDRGMVMFGPILCVIARVLRKRVIIRLFGGSFDSYYATRSKLIRGIIRRTVLASDVCLFQTKSLVKYFVPIAPGRVEWFCNYTRLSSAAIRRGGEPNDSKCKRLIFLGHMWVTKGIDIILQAVPRLPSDLTIDLYGPLDDYSEAELSERGQKRVNYRGILTNEQVMSVLRDYHALVLPTFHEGEGYPGVLIEAFAHGLPVIVSRWMAIPEIVDDTCGILIEPKSVNAFVEAISRLYEDENLYRCLRKGALAKSEQFSDVYWTGRFVGFCVN